MTVKRVDEPLKEGVPFDIGEYDVDAVEEVGYELPGPNKGNGQDRTSFHLSDTGNAELFASLYGDTLRFDHLRGRRLLFRGHRWDEDRDGKWMRLGIEAARHRYMMVPDAPDDQKKRISRHALQSESRNSISAMLKIAEALPPIADNGENWDADPWLLGAPNGVVDLQIGTLREGRPEDRITLSTGRPFDLEACCPRWYTFLDEIFEGDISLIDFIWRAVGYTLTGFTLEQVIFICYGMGANGKTVFLNVLRRVLGDYAYNTPFSTFELHQRASIPSDLAALAGKRLVTASETGEASRLNEQRVKALSGGDPITARAMYHDFFTYTPAMKIWLLVNHKPRVADDTFGFWRRVRLIPFTRQFTTDADRHLEEKLMAEAEGILTWAVLGCFEWQARGLEPPDTVRAATDEYRLDADLLGEFISTCCVLGAEYDASAGILYQTYRKWAEQAGMKEREQLSSTSFGRRMGTKFRKERRGTGNVYLGVGVKSGLV
jgi:putative DNA primase/helicase